MTDTSGKERELHVCPVCGVKVKSLVKHNNKAHDPARLAAAQRASAEVHKRQIAEKNRATIEKARKVFISTLVRCDSCNERVELHLLPDHYYKVHGSSLPKEMLAVYGLAYPKNLFKSSKEREAYWRTSMGLPIEKGSDIYDRGLTVQGGAYGLGKNRKH